ncbi:MAG: hypothetical protein SynsKO_07560 [Synoicihabitans sp.]
MVGWALRPETKDRDLKDPVLIPVQMDWVIAHLLNRVSVAWEAVLRGVGRVGKDPMIPRALRRVRAFLEARREEDPMDETAESSSMIAARAVGGSACERRC